MVHEAAFTAKDLKLLETLEELVDEGYREGLEVKAAVRLKWARSTVRSRLSRMRSKYKSAKEFATEYRSWQQRLYQRTAGQFRSLNSG